MAKTKEEKRKIVRDLTDAAKAAKMIVWLKFSGLSVNSQNELKSRLKEVGSRMVIIKKTLINVALKRVSIEGIDVSRFEETLGFIFINEKDFSPILKVIYDFQEKNNENLVIAGGHDKERLYSVEEIISLAKLPPREILLGKIVSSLFSPISNFVYVLENNLLKLIWVLNALKEKKVEG